MDEWTDKWADRFLVMILGAVAVMMWMAIGMLGWIIWLMTRTPIGGAS